MKIELHPTRPSSFIITLTPKDAHTVIRIARKVLPYIKTLETLTTLFINRFPHE